MPRWGRERWFNGGFWCSGEVFDAQCPCEVFMPNWDFWCHKEILDAMITIIICGMLQIFSNSSIIWNQPGSCLYSHTRRKILCRDSRLPPSPASAGSNILHNLDTGDPFHWRKISEPSLFHMKDLWCHQKSEKSMLTTSLLVFSDYFENGKYFIFQARFLS